MSTDDRGYFAWAKTGHFTLVIALVLTLMILAQLVYVIRIGSNGGAVTYGLFFLVGVHATARSLQELRERRTTKAD